LRAIQANVALALLLGIVEGMSVEEGPDELAADIFQAEFEMGVLVDGVVAAVESGGSDVEALLVGDFFGDDQARGVAGTRGGYGGVVGMREGVAEGDSGRGGLDEFAGATVFEHARLRGHVGISFYTEVESQKSKVAEGSETRGKTRRENESAEDAPDAQRDQDRAKVFGENSQARRK
jgi:hypothetical protein